MTEYEPTADDLQQVREWLEKIPYLPHDMEDHVLAVFYRSCKGSLEKTKERIDNFYHARIKHPELMKNDNILSPVFLNILHWTAILPLPKKTEDGCTVFLGACTDFDINKYNLMEYFQGLIVAFKYCIMHNTLGSGKVQLIMDGAGLTHRHALKASPQTVITAITVLANALPCRVRGLYLVRQPPGIGPLLSLAKTILKAKIAQRVHCFEDHKELLNYISRETLPVDYGGNEEPVKKLYGEYVIELKRSASVFLDEENKLTELDALRPRIEEDILVGSFRRLECD